MPPERPSTRLRYRWELLEAMKTATDVNDVNDVNDDVNDDRARQKRLDFSVDISRAKFEERKGVRVVLLSLDTRGRKRRKRTIE